jgi:aldose 1-epimerase
MAKESGAARVETRRFGTTADGQEVHLHVLESGAATAAVATYGGIVVSLEVPDRHGVPGDVVLGHHTLDGYLRDNRPYLGAIVGRYANRIAGGSFELAGRRHVLARNDGPNHLHGGKKGFDRVVWAGTAQASSRGAAVVLSRVSEDGEEGYPGNLSVSVTYTLTPANELVVDYAATTDRTTLCNLTHHGYFNLEGAGHGDILGHRLLIRASRFTPAGDGLIPTGELRAVAGTPLDFTRPAAVGARIDDADAQLRTGRGYDHNWVLDREGAAPWFAARVFAPGSGRVMDVLTTEPGLQFYSGNFLDGTIVGKGGARYGHRQGLCLETQHFPDSPHHAEFPSTVLEAGAWYRSSTIYRFSVDPSAEGTWP